MSCFIDITNVSQFPPAFKMRSLFYHLLSLVICKMIDAKNYGDSGLPRLLYQSASDKQKKKISGIKSCWESRGQETVSRVQDGLLTDGRHFLVEQIRLLIRHRLICFLSFLPFVASWPDYGLSQHNKENANVLIVFFPGDIQWFWGGILHF